VQNHQSENVLRTIKSSINKESYFSRSQKDLKEELKRTFRNVTKPIASNLEIKARILTHLSQKSIDQGHLELILLLLYQGIQNIIEVNNKLTQKNDNLIHY
jgi:hypothetical protein